jgi:predicted RNase H-like nuclease (RuvC/YqgF family)
MLQEGPQRYKYYKAIETTNNIIPLEVVDDDKKVIITKGLIVPESIMGETKYDVVSGININDIVDELKKSNEEMKKSNEEMKKSIEEMNSRMEKMEAQVELFKREITSNSNLMRTAGENLLELSKRPRYWE